MAAPDSEIPPFTMPARVPAEPEAAFVPTLRRRVPLPLCSIPFVIAVLAIPAPEAAVTIVAAVSIALNCAIAFSHSSPVNLISSHIVRSL